MVYRTSRVTKERKDAKRLHLVATAARVFASRGYHATTVKDIVDEARISIGSYYFYFKSKEDVFEQVHEDMKRRVRDAVDRAIDLPDSSLVQRFSRATAASLWVHQQHRDLARILLIEAPGLNPRFECKQAEERGRSRKRTEAMLTSLAEKKLIRVADVRIAALAFGGTFLNVILDWLYGGVGRLTDAACALAAYNLRALGVTFRESDVKRYVDDYLRCPPADSKEPHLGRSKGSRRP